MLYYILPPIIIVISVSFLIFFLFRKVDEIQAEEILAEVEQENEKNKIAIFAILGHFGLKVLERLMHRSKLLSLKFHNMSNDWFHLIRKKRQKQIEMMKEEATQKEDEAAQEIEIISENNFQEEKLTMPARTKRMVVRPMVRDAVVRPKSKPVVRQKDQLEDVLIKRIAINPKDIEAYERLGDYYMECQNFSDAQECFRQVLKLSPSHYKAKSNIRKIERMTV